VRESTVPFVTRVLALAVTLALSWPATAQTPAATVVDQSGLPLPGATVRLLHDTTEVASTVTGAEGTFQFDPRLTGDVIEVVLSGFETTRVPRASAGRIVLPLARASEVTTVVAPIGATDSPTSAAVGNTLVAETVARMPSKQMKAKESLPLLPAVVRGSDGLMHLGGAPAHDAPVLLDGFNITDPSTGLSSLNLPYEMVRGVEVLRDPMAVTYGGLMAGLITMESRPGSDARRIGVQGFVPRPRLSSPGFGRLEGVFPRVYVDGPLGTGGTRYATAIEYDYERIPVPGVTQGAGPDTVESGTTVFARLDHPFSARQRTTVEGFLFNSNSESQGLSPRRAPASTIDLGARDAFFGVTHRVALSATNVVTIQAGVLGHSTSVLPNGAGLTMLSPTGWSGNWFARASRQAVRTTAALTWDRVRTLRGRAHEFTVRGEVAAERMTGNITEGPVQVVDGDGVMVRSVVFAGPSTFGANDHPANLAVRDVWHVTPRVDLDAGARVDYSRYGGAVPSARAGTRWVLNDDGTTLLRLGFGSFTGTLPLAVPAFGTYPARVDQFWDPATATPVSTVGLVPAVGPLTLPRAVAATASLERRLRNGLDGQVSFTERHSSRIARLNVPADTGALTVESTGIGRYRELQFSGRQTWSGNQELFVSYVISTAKGELNAFTSLYQGLATPLLQPGGVTQLADDARHRIIAWGTVNLPARVVVSPVLEWRSGFRFSVYDERYLYVGAPNSRLFPTFLSLDTVVYKTVTVHNRSADIGVQLFNLTNHTNPRDVYGTMGEPRFGTFTNSVGTIVRGYLMVKW
jgi:hypothetical protein